MAIAYQVTQPLALFFGFELFFALFLFVRLICSCVFVLSYFVLVLVLLPLSCFCLFMFRALRT